MTPETEMPSTDRGSTDGEGDAITARAHKTSE